MVKLLPGEKMVIQEKNKTMIFDSHSSHTGGPVKVHDKFNMPSSGATNSNNLAAQFKKKNLKQIPPMFLNAQQRNLPMNGNNMMGMNNQMNGMNNMMNGMNGMMNGMNGMNNQMNGMNNMMGMNNQNGQSPQNYIQNPNQGYMNNQNNQNMGQGYQQNQGNQGYQNQNKQQMPMNGPNGQPMNNLNANAHKAPVAPQANNYSFKQKDNSAEDPLKKELKEMKAQFAKMMV